MDSGETIPGLDESWTFAGAKLVDWMCGFMTFMILHLLFFHNAARNMPILLAGLIGTALGMAQLRKQFPDEERGIASYIFVKCGFAPPNVPPPAEIQPLWGSIPVQKLPDRCWYNELGLDALFEDDGDEGIQEID